MSSTPPAIILGGSENALSVARSLHGAGVRVQAVGAVPSPVRHSRACAAFADLGSGGDVQGRWLTWLEERGPREGVLLPCDDDGVELIARRRATLVGLGYLPVEAADDVMLAMLDKSRTYEIAREIGVPAPLTFTIRSAEDLEALRDELPYPFALKPVHSHLFRRHFGRTIKAITVHDRAEMEREFATLLPLGLEMLVTEIIPGREDDFYGFYSYLDEDGRSLLELSKRKLRQYPTTFGHGTYHVTVHDREVAEQGLAFFRGVGVRGLANVEFKRDARDGQLKLIECNYRFTSITDLLRVAGIDVTLFTYNRLTGRPLPPVDAYRADVRIWHPRIDARAGLALRRNGELSAREWLRSVAHRQHLPLFDWRDPGPTVGYTWERARRAVARSGPGESGAEVEPAVAPEAIAAGR